MAFTYAYNKNNPSFKQAAPPSVDIRNNFQAALKLPVPLAYDAGKNYAANEGAISAGALYRSLIDNNMANTPASSPVQWEAVALTAGGGGYVSPLHVLEVAEANRDYTSIQTAINAAVPGDVVVVYAGSYNEQITLQSGVPVIGINNPLIYANTIDTVCNATLPLRMTKVSVPNETPSIFHVRYAYSPSTCAAVSSKPGNAPAAENAARSASRPFTTPPRLEMNTEFSS